MAALIVILLEGRAGQAAAASPPANGLRGSQASATLLCKFAGASHEPVSVSYFNTLLSGSSKSLDAYWREVSYGAIDLAGSAAFGWFTMPGDAASYLPPARSLANLTSLARDCTAAADPTVDFRRFSGLNLVFNTCIERPRGGEVTLRLDGKRRRISTTWLCSGWSSTHRVLAHETGHSFGLSHSRSPSGNEYGNPWDSLSSGPCCARDPVLGVIAQHPIAHAKDLLGWIPPQHKFVAIFRASVELELQALSGGNPQPGLQLMVEIPVPGQGGKFYTLEARRRTGFDSGLPADAVVIHLVDPKNTAAPAELILPPGDWESNPAAGAWMPGMTFRDEAAGVVVRILAETPHGFKVAVSTGR